MCVCNSCDTFYCNLILRVIDVIHSAAISPSYTYIYVYINIHIFICILYTYIFMCVRN